MNRSIVFELYTKKDLVASCTVLLKDLSFGIDQHFEQECENQTYRDIMIDFSSFIEKRCDFPLWKDVIITSPASPMSPRTPRIKGEEFSPRSGSISKLADLFKIKTKIDDPSRLKSRSNSVTVPKKSSHIFIPIKAKSIEKFGQDDATLKYYLESLRRKDIQKENNQTQLKLNRKSDRKSKKPIRGSRTSLDEARVLSQLKFFPMEDGKSGCFGINLFDEANCMHRLFAALENRDEGAFLLDIDKKDVDSNWKHPKDNQTLLQRGVSLGYLNFVEIMLESGFNPNETDSLQRSVLMLAAASGNKEMCLYLISMGASVIQKDGFGYTCLFIALKHHHFHLVEDLILFGGDINVKRDHGITPIHESLLLSDYDMLVEIMKIKGVKLNQRDGQSKTPLLKACEISSMELYFKFLGYQDVDYCVTDDSGRNMFHLLAFYKRSDIIQQFLTLNRDFSHFKTLLIQKDHKRGRIPLHIAIESKDFACVKLFLDLYDKLKVDKTMKDQSHMNAYQIGYMLLERDYKKHNRDSEPIEQVYKQMNPDLIMIEQFLYRHFQK